MPFPTFTPQNPLVLNDTLCWVGPGPGYKVVSGLLKDTRVKLIGRASIGGWWIVENPIYGTSCWIMEKDLQIEAGTEVLSLPVISPPEKPKPRPVPILTP